MMTVVSRYGFWSSATQYWPPSGILSVDFKEFKASTFFLTPGPPFGSWHRVSAGHVV